MSDINNDAVMLSYGSGGADMNEFIKDFILPRISPTNEISLDGDGFASDEISLDETKAKPQSGLNQDAAVISHSFAPVISTDSFVLDPIFINGTNIGEIAACGSINDVLMMGARPLYITLGLILEEGLRLDELARVLESFGRTCKAASVSVICGDLKVVPKGKCDKIFINTTCIGERQNSHNIGSYNISPGDIILLSGDIGRHGACVLAAREGFELDVRSDAKPLLDEVGALIDANISIKAMRDATRGGVAAVLGELARDSGYKLLIDDENIACDDGVAGLCELLGYERLELANEGTFVCVVAQDSAKAALDILRSYNTNANIIGSVLDTKLPIVSLRTPYGTRVCSMPRGEILPRIC